MNAGSRVEAAFTPYPQPKELKIPDTTGRVRTRQVPGYVTFQLNGDTMRLEPVEIGNELLFMFKDRTSGRETYGAGRYLDSEMPKNGRSFWTSTKCSTRIARETAVVLKAELRERHSTAPPRR